MKLIHKFKSPNFDNRKFNNICFIIIHYTALESISESIKYLCSKKNKVSSHYLISKSGSIYNLVSENKRAWHAGISYWNEFIDINSLSIGIELDYQPSRKNTKYEKNLIISLTKLLKYLKKKYKIKKENILGHSDIAPYRKIDPGKFFPWGFFESKKIVYQIENIKDKKLINKILNKWYLNYKFFSNKKKVLFMLNFIGYDVSLAINDKTAYKKLILNYGNRFKYYKNYNYNNKKIFDVIKLHFLNILLTKLKK